MSGVLTAPWQRSLLQRLASAHDAGQLGHALLLVGDAGLGKRAVAHALAQRMLCTSPSGETACGQCRGCTFFLGGTHPDLRHVTLEVNEKTGKLRGEIIIEQIRRLGQWCSLTTQLGGAQVVIIEPADRLNRNAANSLLKTLEEPATNRFLLLVSSSAHQLPATIRSRCQRYELKSPAAGEALAWLQSQGVKDAPAALEAAHGNPGLALSWRDSGLLALNKTVVDELQALAAGRTGSLELAKAWSADEDLSLRLRIAADYAQALCAGLQGLNAPRGLTAGMDFQKLSAWFDAANRLRGLLDTTIRKDLSVAGLLRDWRLACTNQR